MKPIRFGNKLTPVLLSACAVFGGILLVEWYALSGQDEALTVRVDQPATAPDAALTRSRYAAPQFEAFSEILERPLFSEGRTPPEQPSDQQSSAGPIQQTPLAMRLEGVALTPVAKVAIVRDITSNKLLRLEEGAIHQGWRLESVQATSATLKRGEQTRELILELDKKPVARTAGQSRNTRRQK
jgi:hypothetical protein